MRFVDDQQIGVPVQDLDLERHPLLRDRVPVEEHERVRLEGRLRVDRAPDDIHDLAGLNLLLHPLAVGVEPLQQVVERGRPMPALRQPDATGVQPVPDR